MKKGAWRTNMWVHPKSSCSAAVVGSCQDHQGLAPWRHRWACCHGIGVVHPRVNAVGKSAAGNGGVTRRDPASVLDRVESIHFRLARSVPAGVWPAA